MGSDRTWIGSRDSGRGFNPRPPHGERRDRIMNLCGDNSFNPRPPHGERPHVLVGVQPVGPVSTHAPRMGSDTTSSEASVTSSCFNPRPPHGERPQEAADEGALLEFQPTPPAWGATPDARGHSKIGCRFNPRPPHGERPSHPRHPQASCRRFNPRPPHGERPALREQARCRGRGVSTHAPRMGSDLAVGLIIGASAEFQPTPPAWGATAVPRRPQ